MIVKEKGAISMRTVGTVVRGIRCPIIRNGDDLVSIVADSLMASAKGEGFSFKDKDIVGVTEAVVARAQGNYATVQDIADDISQKFSCDTLGVVFPILSRNRFAICLRGVAMGVKKIVLMLSYPSDEVGNHLFDYDLLEEKGVNPWSDSLTESQYREKFAYSKHPFTGIDYVEYYKSIIEQCGCKAEIIFSNNPAEILSYTWNVLVCDIHNRKRTVAALKKSGVKKVHSLDEILTSPGKAGGYNEKWGLLGSNKATEDGIKLFPRESQAFVEELQKVLIKRTGRQIEVLVYGDGAFKDPQGKIWELADPVVSPGFTAGLLGTPNEFKLKYLADNQFSHLSGQALEDAIKDFIGHKDEHLADSMQSQGTTPRQLTDLVGSLCDLTSGSGDKGTPIILVQGYFDNYSV